MAKDKETLKFHFYVIACFGKKNQPFKGDQAGRFVGYWSDCSPWKNIYAVRKYPTKAAAKAACKKLNSNKYHWYTGKVRKYTATIEETNGSTSALNWPKNTRRKENRHDPERNS